MDSILDSVKKTLSIHPDDTAFDVDIMLHINSIFSTLHQLGIGPVEGFMIEDNDATWSEFLGSDLRLNSVKSFMYFKVRLAFDPPQTSYLLQALENQAKELEWRLSETRETDSTRNPNLPVVTS